MSTASDPGSLLTARLDEIATALPNGAIGVSMFDYLSGGGWGYQRDRWFHAASTIKIAIMAAVYAAIDDGRFEPKSRLHVRNYFRGATDGRPFRVQANRDADTEVYSALGRTMRIAELVRHMIGSSSNLATNLLLDLVGIDAARQALAERRIEGIDLRRGVEDESAFQAGCNNLATADGLVRLLRVIYDGAAFTPESTRAMLDALLEQRFAGAIAPGLPDHVRVTARVAHKTGDISTVSHDAGIVFLASRPPYIVALLAESPGDGAERTPALVDASRAVYDVIVAVGEGLSA